MQLHQYDTLLIEPIGENAVVVTLNRPESANAINTRMSCDLYQLFESLAMDAGDLRCILVTGAGRTAFCAGADLKERRNMSNERWARQHAAIERMARAIVSCPVPLIGAINGAAYGGGCEIALLLDFLYAADTARFALPETSIGIIPGAGGTQTLARAIGERRAKEVIMGAEPFTAAQALEWGMVNKVLPAQDLRQAAIAAAKRISANAPIAVKQAKMAVHQGLQMSLADAMAFEIEAYNRTVPTRDRKEGVLAFNEKRKPEFKGR